MLVSVVWLDLVSRFKNRHCRKFRQTRVSVIESQSKIIPSNDYFRHPKHREKLVRVKGVEITNDLHGLNLQSADKKVRTTIMTDSDDILLLGF